MRRGCREERASTARCVPVTGLRWGRPQLPQTPGPSERVSRRLHHALPAAKRGGSAIAEVWEMRVCTTLPRRCCRVNPPGISLHPWGCSRSSGACSGGAPCRNQTLPGSPGRTAAKPSPQHWHPASESSADHALDEQWSMPDLITGWRKLSSTHLSLCQGVSLQNLSRPANNLRVQDPEVLRLQRNIIHHLPPEPQFGPEALATTAAAWLLRETSLALPETRLPKAVWLQQRWASPGPGS